MNLFVCLPSPLFPLQIAKPTEIADLKRRSSVMATSDSAGLQSGWVSRMRDGNIEFYSGRATLLKYTACVCVW